MPKEHTNRIYIKAISHYIKEHSMPSEKRYVFSYTISIKNTGDSAAQLITRHWVITDASGNEHEVFGEGVIGEQPLLQPGQHFEYTSATVLETPVGYMCGHYQMVNIDGVAFQADIPAFTLSQPNQLH